MEKYLRFSAQSAFLTRGRADRAGLWIHKGFHPKGHRGLKEWNNSAYFRLKKISCEFKEQARARHPGEKCGLDDRSRIN